MDEVISVEVEISESLRAEIGDYLDTHRTVSFDRLVQMSVQSYLNAVSPSVRRSIFIPPSCCLERLYENN
jgi:hypothetical protein